MQSHIHSLTLTLKYNMPATEKSRADYRMLVVMSAEKEKQFPRRKTNKSQGEKDARTNN